MGDGRALQSATSHDLGQNFARAFDIQYQDPDGGLQLCWTTSWGLSTRFIGAMVMVHGDDNGLILPPRLAPHQVVIVPIWKTDEEKALVMEAAGKVKDALAGFRVTLDDRDQLTPGFKFNDWELRGVPLRVEIGPRDVRGDQVVLARRDIPGRDGKTPVGMSALAGAVGEMLDHIHDALLEKAAARLEENTAEPSDYAELQEALASGFALAWWCGSADCERKVQDETKATTRCIPFEQEGGSGQCAVCGSAAEEKVIWARAY
jgi:prolyl-tRNA synthetase